MRKIIVVVLLIVFSAISGFLRAEEIDTSSLLKRCESMTNQQKELAKAAGYDLESLCKQAKLTVNNKKNNLEQRTERPQPGSDAGDLLFNPRPDNMTMPFHSPALKAEDQLVEKFGNNQKVDDEIPLEKYGYSLFANSPTTFAPVTDLPVPVDYVLGVGDQIKVQLVGKKSSSHELVIERDGSINFPEIGPVALAGLMFSDAQKLIQKEVSSRMIGVEAYLTLGQLRSINVFVLGEAFSPGSYSVSSLSTMLNAIMVSGGVTDIASLRNIQLKRNGAIVSRLDLYDVLQKGDTQGDAILKNGDVIFIPAAQRYVSVDGAVVRPAIYEIAENETLGDLVRIAGGLAPNAYGRTSHIERNATDGFRNIIDVDLTASSVLSMKIKVGDKLIVSETLETLENIVTLTGHFHRPRQVKWFDGMRVSDVIRDIGELKDNPEMRIGLIARKEKPLRKLVLLDFDIEEMFKNKKGENDTLLLASDEIIVLSSTMGYDKNTITDTKNKIKEDFESDLRYLDKVNSERERKKSQGQTITSKDYAGYSLNHNVEMLLDLELLFAAQEERSRVLNPIIKMIERQSGNGELIDLVEINGNVKFPGIYPKTKDMALKDLVYLAGGLNEASYLGGAEITRRNFSDAQKATIDHHKVDLAKELTGVGGFVLSPKDKVVVYLAPEYAANMSIEIIGQVKFPGVYEFRQGETLSQVVDRAGGFTESAHLQAAVFTRVDLKELEEKRLADLKERLKSDIAAIELSEKVAGESTSLGQANTLLGSLGKVEAIGRLVIQLEQIMTHKIEDIQLKHGDKLVIPTLRQEISVLGEVQHATSHIFNPEWTLDDYVEHSGGMTNRADDDRVYVVRVDGSVFLPNQSGWLTHQNQMLLPGDAIVVPQDTDRIKSLTLWTNVSQIVYQMSLGAAAIAQLTNAN